MDATTICLDLGHKSIAAENPLPRIQFLNAPDARPISQSEEHMVVQVAEESNYQIGDVWYGIPVHICPTCALYDHVQVAGNYQIYSQWPVIARSRVITI